MAFMAVLESDLRALSAEARRRYPAVKDAAEHAILKLRTMSNPNDIANSEEILRIFLMACEVRTVKLSVIGLSCLQKLISHDAVAPSALQEILSTLKEHAEMSDESVQLKTLQTILIIFQSRLHPEDEENMAQALCICLRLLENNRSSDSVRNTAAATFRQAVALVFDHLARAESLPSGKFGSVGQIYRSNSVTGDVSRSIHHSEEYDTVSVAKPVTRDSLTKAGAIGLRLLEDLTALAAGGSAAWLHITSVQRSFALDILEFILSNYVAVFRILGPYEQVLRHQICSLLMTSLRTNAEVEGEAGEPFFRRLVLRSVGHVIRYYSSSLITESEVFLSILVRVTTLDLPLWHRILVLEILRGFCVEARTMHILFQTFDMDPSNTNVVEYMVKALARVVSYLQVQDTSEESLAAVAGMFSSKAKGIEWSLDNDASNAAVLVASEAHAITLAIEGLLGVVFTIATLTDEAVDMGELESPKCESDAPAKLTGKTASLCYSMVDSLWLTILDTLSLILARTQGEAIVLEILKGYQAFTQACGVLQAIEPLNSFLASLCKFTISIPVEVEKKSSVQSPMSKRTEALVDQRDSIVLTPKNVQALRTLFNIAHRLHNVLGPSWVLVLETLAALDRAIHSPHATTQEVSTVTRLSRESSGQYSDFNILSSLNSQLFESSALMHISAVKSLVSALCLLSEQSLRGASSGSSPASIQKMGSISFSVERIICILINNVHRVESLWDPVVSHFLELAENSNQHLRNMALDALDKSVCAVLESQKLQDRVTPGSIPNSKHIKNASTELRSLERAVIAPLRILYFSAQSFDVRARSLKILLHVLEIHGEKLYDSWSDILEMLRSVACAPEKDLVTLGFQSLRVVMNDGLSAIPIDCLKVCIDVTGAYSTQKTELNISLTAIGLLWTTTDFIAKGLSPRGSSENGKIDMSSSEKTDGEWEEEVPALKKASGQDSLLNDSERDELLITIFSLLQTLGADERPEVRNAAIRTLFQILGTHGQKLSQGMWEDCLWNYVFPSLDRSSHMAATSSRDEWHGKELGTRDGKAVHMLIHHSRNTAQKQWDETLVVVLGGIARILRSFFPYLRTFSNFWSGWQSLVNFVSSSILNGSKEVALAGINCLQTTVLSHSAKGNLPIAYLKSVLDVYGHVLLESSSHVDLVLVKVKQETLHGLGELFAHAYQMFDVEMYQQLLEVVHVVIQTTITAEINDVDTVSGCLPPLQRTVLEVLPLLCPSEQLSTMWSQFLQSILKYLPRAHPESKLQKDGKLGVARGKIHEAEQAAKHEIFNGASSASLRLMETTEESDISSMQSSTFSEKLIPVIIDVFLRAPDHEKYTIYPEIIQTLGRCMTTRRDCPDSAVWRLAVEGFNNVLVSDIGQLSQKSETLSSISTAAKNRIWKEIADVYEIFLVGYCGRALSSNSMSTTALKTDMSLDMAILSTLGDKILKSQINAPVDILQRLVTTLDRCASRTCSLPVETVELLPSHCLRFSLASLQKLFTLTSFGNAGEWNLTRLEISKIAVKVLIERCENIFNRLLIDEAALGDRPLPSARFEEVVYVLQELAHLRIHPDILSVLPLHSSLKHIVTEGNHEIQAHLLALHPSLCELVVSREPRVRELVQVLLRLISQMLGLRKLTQTLQS